MSSNRKDENNLRSHRDGAVRDTEGTWQSVDGLKPWKRHGGDTACWKGHLGPHEFTLLCCSSLLYFQGLLIGHKVEKVTIHSELRVPKWGQESVQGWYSHPLQVAQT